MFGTSLLPFDDGAAADTTVLLQHTALGVPAQAGKLRPAAQTYPFSARFPSHEFTAKRGAFQSRTPRGGSVSGAWRVRPRLAQRFSRAIVAVQLRIG